MIPFDIALLEDAIVGRQVFEVVAYLQERIAERPDIVEQRGRQILLHAADAKLACMRARRGAAPPRHAAAKEDPPNRHDRTMNRAVSALQADYIPWS
jgi:hypothetical protein